jgi:hypothetical protein
VTDRGEPVYRVRRQDTSLTSAVSTTLMHRSRAPASRGGHVGHQRGYVRRIRQRRTVMSDEPITDAPQSTEEQEAPAPERPSEDNDTRPSQAEGERDDEQS